MEIDLELTEKSAKNTQRWWKLTATIYRHDRVIVGFTLTVVDQFRGFLSQFSTNFHEILDTLFYIHVVTALKVSRSLSNDQSNF